MPTGKRSVRQADIVRAFAERLRGTRQARGMTQRDLATKAHVTFSYVSRLEAGGAAPGIDLLERLAEALGVGVAELLPPAGSPATAEAGRERVRALFEAVLPRAGQETLSMLEVLLARVAESPAASR
ncbi:MAG TPA: helix-turn-helix transcriptional regulator [Urbifossiella sp.]|nr:helix-turn-helix transcriptional regulator [Urbifossiella sp.]